MIAALLEAAPRPGTAGPETMSLPCEAALVTRQTGTPPSCALDLSRSRTHDAVLDILKAYKLSGNFHANLEAVLKDMGIVDKVTYQIEPNPALAYPDCRHVVFRLNENVPHDRFDDIIRSIEARIGFDAPWWGRLFSRFNTLATAPNGASRVQMRRAGH
jgi:hypothetical protein